ncbi:MFS transporter [Campylobacter helveticus]|uniref:MFS transporter n=2 Tax=Campylobacter helveticus TaxID=28898 RepID=A0AAX2UM87_9BACT|nr:MFS transporter [Campylobacter helveticus]ARE80010.1 putative sugar transporter, major facilitator superfamily [Campylobacter helveticus]MCR2039588.1 MFS transporter [Campylobacter helveticus]MCR2054422.1 MFS transporter [Campylobacter helveticus]MCR2056525.1 MFS transporter [Campylobacter helveticus]MCR2062649.1 MFS transporter [Campylobacter helveticus]
MRSIMVLSFIVATRFFGLFIVLPVLSLYALKLENANDFLVGLLVGAYALMQMLFQVPFGVLSDKIGRKKTMLLGLVIFIIGSLICSSATDIYTMLLGRILQGSGAIGAVASALISDFVSEEKRGKAMAMMGGFIGIAFALSMVLAPIMSAKYGLSSLFDLSAALSFFCIILLYTAVPKEPKITHENDKTPLLSLLKQKNLALMNATNFMQKMLMSIAFLAIPIVLVGHFGYEKLWVVYSASMLVGFVAMGFAGAFAEKRGKAKQILLLGVAFFILSYIFFAFFENLIIFMVAVVIFFLGFNLHEPIMQSCASKFCKVNEKGKALGAFNAFGYAGSFSGGLIGGAFLHFDNLKILALILILLALIWFFSLLFLKNPAELKNLYLPLDTKLDLNAVSKLKGVLEVYRNSQHLVVKFDKAQVSQEDLEKSL